MDIKDRVMLEFEIKKDIPQFDRDKVIDYTKGVILNIFNSFASNDLNNIKIRISSDLLKKISDNRELYRISKNFDSVVVQNVSICDYEKREDGNYVKVRTTVNFFDNVDNNEDGDKEVDKFWSDRWIITYKALSNIDNNCKNCGSEMEYNKETDTYECKFCRSVFYKDSKDWKVVDIEVEQ